MCRYIVIFCLSHSFLLERPLEKYIDKPHHCISCRVESVVKKVVAYSPEFTVTSHGKVQLLHESYIYVLEVKLVC